ncbi:hypothetical protein [Azospirillum sp. sgz301742]
MGGAGSIPPPPPTAVAAPATTPGTAQVLLGEAAVVKLPERLQDLPRAVALTGTVAGTTPEGLTRIRTQMGDVLLDLAATLSADKPVTVQISPGQPPGRAMVFANTPPTTGQAGAAPPQPQPAGTPPAVLLTLPSAAPAAPGAAVPLLLPGSVLPALVLAAAKPATPPGPSAPTSAAPASRPTPATAAPAAPSSAAPTAPTAAPPAPASTAQPAAPPAGPPSGAPVQLGGDAAHPGASPTLPNGAKPEVKPDPTAAPKAAPQAAPAPQTTSEAGPQTTPKATPQAVPDAAPQPLQPSSVPAKPAPMLVQGATVALKVVSVAQPGTAAPIPLEAPLTSLPAADNDRGPLLHGTVAGATPQGQPILATRQGMLVLTTQGPLPPGTRATVVLTDPLRAQHAAAPHGAEAPADAKDWPALRQVMAALAAADPELARTLTNTVLPQPNKKLAAALTFLLSAMRGGDARGWLGEEATATLERTGQGALLKQLEEELRTPPRPAAADAPPSDWKLFAVPMLDGRTLQPMQVQIRRVDGDEGGGSKGEREARGSRFVIDLELSRFGPLQLDGLVRPQRFDLILRTHTPFPAELNAELTGIFADSLGAVGFTGTLSFQNGARNWVKLTRAGRAGLGVTA